MNVGNVGAPDVSIEDLLLDGRVRLEDLVDRDALDELCRSFVVLFGIPVRIYSSEGALLADAAAEQELCAYVNTTANGQRACASIVGAVKARDAGASGDVIHPCFTGAAYRIIALEYDGRRVGRIIVGPFLPSTVVSAPSSLARHRRGDRQGARDRALRQDAEGEARDDHAHHRSPQGLAGSHLLQRAQGARHEQDAPRERARELPPARGQDGAPSGGVRSPQGARPAEIELPGDRQPRASHPAHVDHRVQRDAGRRASRARSRPSSSIS